MLEDLKLLRTKERGRNLRFHGDDIAGRGLGFWVHGSGFRGFGVQEKFKLRLLQLLLHPGEGQEAPWAWFSDLQAR